MPDQEKTARELFYEELLSAFRAIRPQYTKDVIDITDPNCQKLLIIDRTLSNPDTFEAGLSIWLENKDTEAFLSMFSIVSNSEGKLELVANPST